MADDVSILERARLGYVPRRPRILHSGFRNLGIAEDPGLGASVTLDPAVAQRFPRTCGRPPIRVVDGDGPPSSAPLRLGVVLSGGQAPGGHNVICGLFDALREADPRSVLLGFRGGPRGVIEGQYLTLESAHIDPVRNTGGFDLIGSGRDKIETEAQLAASQETVQQLQLDGLVIIGGDDSNTNAAILAEHFLEAGLSTSVVGVPKTIDGDLKSELVEVSFGFDTATKVYAELIGNICRDAKSAGKYWHFVKLMGRSASHVTLECALRTQPNVAFIGEEVQQQAWTLRQVVDQIVTVIRQRSEQGLAHGVCLVPEGLIEFIPEMRTLIEELNGILSSHQDYFSKLKRLTDQQEFINQKLDSASGKVFSSLPSRIQSQLLLDRDSHGNVQVSKIETEVLLMEQVADAVAEAGFRKSFSVQGHFLGYEGRCAAPTNFDADYTYTLGRLAATLVAFRCTGYMCSVRHLVRGTEHWSPLGVPLTSMMQIERRKGRDVPVIAKALVQTDGEPFRRFAAARSGWAAQDAYRYPGAIQYFGPPEVADRPPLTLHLERAEG